MRRSRRLLFNGLLASILAVGIPALALAVEPGSGSPLVSYAPLEQYPLDNAQCQAKLARDVPGAALSGEFYRCKIDFARLEHDYPLTRDDLSKITPDNLQAADEEQLDQIYARLTAGTIPDGPYEIFTFRRREFGPALGLAQRLAGEQLQGLALLLSRPEEAQRELFRQVWRSKAFNKKAGVVRTRIGNVPLLKSLFPQREEATRTEHEPAGEQSALLFPAKVYCGQSLLDGRRESIVIDYAYSHEISDYMKEIDWLTGPHGLQVRDEIRMVRPGFYLGRVYMGRIFVLHFILYNETVAKQTAAPAEENCWIGSQRIAASAK